MKTYNAILDNAATEYRTTMNYLIKLGLTDVKVLDVVKAVAENCEIDAEELQHHITTYKF